jgi:hypothetical protein
MPCALSTISVKRVSAIAEVRTTACQHWLKDVEHGTPLLQRKGLPC